MNIDLSEPLGENSIVITDGMAWILYTDQGPAGICGQSMSITRPHTVLRLWSSEDAMQKELNGREMMSLFRRGVKQTINYGVVGQFSTSNAKIVFHQ